MEMKAMEGKGQQGRGRWSAEQAWAWKARHPWLRGCNYMPADCANRIDQWQALDCEKHFETAATELKLAHGIGFNTVRLILEFTVWDQDHDGFMARLDRFLDLAWANGIAAMICFGNDCTVPKSDANSRPHLGPQHCDWGYHGGRRKSQHGSFVGQVGYSLLDDEDTRERFFQMVAEIVAKYAHDERVVVWDLFNEPGNNGRKDISIPHVQRIFDTARACAPDQPLTTATWHGKGRLFPVERLAMDLSDVISFHSYTTYAEVVELVAEYRKEGRPLMCSEWLNRIANNTIQEIFPLFYLMGVDCWMWGFVAGLYQTYEPWESYWNMVRDGSFPPDFDITKWQHDLIRPSLRPYDPREVELIRRFTALADQDFAGRR